MMILQDSGVALVLTSGAEEFEGVPVIRVPLPDKPGTKGVIPGAEASPGSLAYIIYTSGTTGRPKGVKISRNALATFISGALSIYNTTPADRILQFCNLSFDASVEEIFLAFCTGASLYLRDEEMVKPEKLIGFSLQHHITTWDLPTAFWRQVIQSDHYALIETSTWFRLVIIGGEALLPGDILRWESQMPGHRLINTYGPTETTVVAIAHEVFPGLKTKFIPIGRPLPGYRIFIVNSELRSVLLGCTGELLIAGNGLASGYVNREKEEKDAFIPFQPPGNRETVLCYRTGDRVAAGMDGTIYYMGRTDTQLKIRGFRIEPGEIEEQISKIEGVESCVVVASRKDEPDYRLIAFVQGDLRVNTAEARTALSQVLPAYMMPEKFIRVDKIPLTSNGKADRKRLLQMTAPGEYSMETMVTPPFTPDEILVYELWKKILNVREFGIDDDFFELGGHSLKAIEFMSEVRKHRGVDIPIASLITNPTVRKFANLLSSGEHGTYWQCMVPIRTEGMKTPLFLIHGAGLNILLYQSLSRYLKPGRPVYALQAKGLDGKSEIRTHVGEMARDYVREIEAIRPSGPIIVLGFSLGGFIAYEISRLMIEKGREVVFTGIIDAVISLTKCSETPLRQFFIRIKHTFLKICFNSLLITGNLFKPGSTILKSKYQTFMAILVSNLTRMGFIRKKENKIEYVDGKPQYSSNHVRILMWRALKQFSLIPTNIKIDLFKAGIATFYIPDRKDYGWSRFARKGVAVHTLPAEHSLLFADPNDKIFAKILDDRLDELENNAQ
jgi:amino acid adenylation domain-containing protein